MEIKILIIEDKDQQTTTATITTATNKDDDVMMAAAVTASSFLTRCDEFTLRIFRITAKYSVELALVFFHQSGVCLASQLWRE